MSAEYHNGAHNAATLHGDSGALPFFPGEKPSYKDLHRWLQKSETVLEQTIFGPALRDVTPDYGVTELTAEQMSKAGPIELARYQRELAKARADEAVRARQLEIGQAEYKNKLAALLKAALRPKAALRLGKLLKDHKDDASGTHDGVAMWKALVKLKYEPSSMIEQREHDRAVEAARDTSLPDG